MGNEHTEGAKKGGRVKKGEIARAPTAEKLRGSSSPGVGKNEERRDRELGQGALVTP